MFTQKQVLFCSLKFIPRFGVLGIAASVIISLCVAENLKFHEIHEALIKLLNCPLKFGFILLRIFTEAVC